MICCAAVILPTIILSLQFPVLLSCLDRIGVLQSKMFNRQLAQLEFLDLPRHGRRKALDEPYVLRRFELRELSNAVVTHLILGYVDAVACSNARENLFAVSVVRDSNHLDVLGRLGACREVPQSHEERCSRHRG